MTQSPSRPDVSSTKPAIDVPPYLRRLERRIDGETVAMGVGFFLIEIRASADNLWRPPVWGFEDLLASAGSGSTLMAIQFFLLGDLLPRYPCDVAY